MRRERIPATVTGWGILDIMAGEEDEYFIEGNKDKRITNVSSITEANDSDLTFCSWSGEKAYKFIAESDAGIILCKMDLKGFIHPRKGAAIVFLNNPRLAFVRFANKIQTQNRRSMRRTRISPTAVIARNVSIGTNCSIGNFVSIGENCVIGDNTVIRDRVTLAQNCRIGKNCLIQSGVTLGEDGFAYERHNDNGLERFPHFRGVVIGDNVEICANTNIARGSLTDTVIGDGTKIDAMVHIAHNVKIGRNCQLTGGTVIGGSAVLGDCCWTGLNCTIKNKVTVGNNVIIGAGACVIHDVADGDIVAGIPAKSIKEKVTTSEIFLMAGQRNNISQIGIASRRRLMLDERSDK